MVSKARERSGKSATAEKLMAIEVNGERLVIDTKAMTIAERQLVRGELAKLPAPDSTDSLVGAIWIRLREKDETLTFAEVCESLTVGDMDAIEFFEAETDTPEA
jgi:hypothetical protein